MEIVFVVASITNILYLISKKCFIKTEEVM